MPAPNTALLMFISYRWAENEIYRSLVDAGFGDVTLAQGRLFARVSEDGSRVTDLAEAGQVTKQTAGYLVDQLEATGYVERVPDPRDARARLVRITERGRQAQAAARKVEERIEREWTELLGTRRMGALREALEVLRETTDPYR